MCILHRTPTLFVGQGLTCGAGRDRLQGEVEFRKEGGSESVIRISSSGFSLLNCLLSEIFQVDRIPQDPLLGLRKTRDVRNVGSSSWGVVSVTLLLRYRTKRVELHIWRGFIIGIAYSISEAEKSHKLLFEGWGSRGLLVHFTEMHRLHLDRRTGDGRIPGRDKDSFSFSRFLVSQEDYQHQVGSMGGTMDLSHGKEQWRVWVCWAKISQVVGIGLPWKGQLGEREWEEERKKWEFQQPSSK